MVISKCWAGFYFCPPLSGSPTWATTWSVSVFFRRRNKDTQAATSTPRPAVVGVGAPCSRNGWLQCEREVPEWRVALGGCPLSLWLQLGNAVRYPNVPAAAQGRAHFPAPFDLSGHLIDLTQVCYTVRDKSFIITQSAFYGTFQRQTKTESPVHTQLITELYRLSAHRRGPPNPHTMGVILNIPPQASYHCNCIPL